MSFPVSKCGIACKEPVCKTWDHVLPEPFTGAESHILDHIAVRTPGGYKKTTRLERMAMYRAVKDALIWCGMYVTSRANIEILYKAERQNLELRTEVARLAHLEEENLNLRAEIIKLKQECKKNS